MKSNFRGLVTLLAKNLYSETDVFVRELIQNAHDGIQFRRVLEPGHSGQIQLNLDAANRTINVTDNGLGMNQGVIEEFLSTIGASGTGSMREEPRFQGKNDLATIGRFGIGLLSAFVVADRIDIYTRPRENGEAWHWVNVGDDDYELSPTTEMPHIGTQVIVSVKPEYAEFLREETIKAAIRKYADLLAVPIFLNGNGPVNALRPPWHIAASLAVGEREEYLTRFLHERYHDSPLLVIPVDLPKMRTQGVLYITDQHIPGINTSGFLDIYQNGMCLRAKDTDLLPDWARFVRGMIESQSLQPTAARDNIQRDEAHYALKNAIGEVIIDAIIETATLRPQFFPRLCAWHHFHFKGMCLVDERLFERLIPFLPFETSEGTMTLGEYRERKGGKIPVALHYFPDHADAARLYESCRMRGIIALNAGKCFEQQLLEKLDASQPGHWSLRRLDRSDSEDIYQPLSAEEKQKFVPLTAAVEEVLRQENLAKATVSVRRFEPRHISSVLVTTRETDHVESLRALLSHPAFLSGMESAQNEFLGSLAEAKANLFLNAENPLVQRLAGLGDWQEAGSRSALVSLYVAALAQSKGRMSPENARAIHRHLVDWVERGLRLQAEMEETREQLNALQKVVCDKNRMLSSREWVAAASALYGKSPASFREEVAAASDEEIARLLVDLLIMSEQKAAGTRPGEKSS